MKIVITGANGSFGGAMVRYFSDRGHEVVGCGRQDTPPKQLLERASYVPIDITRDFALPEGDVLIHAAAHSDDKAHYRDLIEPNITGTRRIVKNSPDFRKYIHISSSSVYLPQEEKIDESLAGKQNNRKLSAYGLSKLRSEEQVLKHSTHESAFILRARAFYGVGDTKIVPRILKFIKNEKIVIPGKLNNRLSMTHYSNMGHAIECCIESDKTGVNIYNVADDETYIMIKVIREVSKLFYDKVLPEKNISLALLKLLAVFRIGGITPLLIRAVTKDMVLDIDKIKRELNYKPEMDFYKAIPELKAWIQRSGGYDIFQEPSKELSWMV